MKQIFYSLAILLMGVASCSSPKEKQIIACGDDKAVIIDVEQSTEDSTHIVWRWKVSDAASQLPPEYQKLMVPLDECKPVNGGKEILLTSSGGGALLLDKETKQCRFYAHVPMAHSIEMLPGRRIAIALSTHPQGNSLELYDADKPAEVLFRDSLYSGHGVVWMEKSQRLYALGFDELRAYTLEQWETDAPLLKLEKTWKLPIDNGHDLVRLSDYELGFSGYEDVYKFDLANETSTLFQPMQGKKDIKSFNYDAETGYLVYTQAEIDWWTHHIYIEHPMKVLTLENINLYKVRTFE